MSALFPDTHPKVEALQLQIVRQMPPWEKNRPCKWFE